ncbi:hyphally regulated cell wall protein, partial [Scheffersomyces xylosifermentans]|uniref:hyphally regulated cell wall protein n=1 Tax=Scheffersomyces xylosifermentans TaxID=1304137 RepID=UPI00315D71D1
MLFRKYLAIVLSIATVWATTISSNTITRGSVNLNDAVTVNNGVYWSIIDNLAAAFGGDLTVGTGSGLYITTDNNLIAQSVTLLSGNILNNGIISFNALNSLLAPTYNLVGLTFTNNGEMYLGGNGSTGTPVMSITTPSWNNNGLLVFYQQSGSAGTVSLGTPLGTINNNGQICLYNEVYSQSNNIAGTGCITANGGSSIYLSGTTYTVASTQVINLADSASVLVAGALLAAPTYTVSGFGNGNIIATNVVLLGPLLGGISYSSTTGILKVSSLTASANFIIGPGYVQSNIKIVSYGGLLGALTSNAVTYAPPPPNAPPAVCKTCKLLPTAPGVNPTLTTTTVVSTYSNGAVCTDVQRILISTDTSGNWFTSTSTVSEVCTSNPTKTVTTT